jgi:hypothetical protein
MRVSSKDTVSPRTTLEKTVLPSDTSYWHATAYYVYFFLLSLKQNDGSCAAMAA